MIETWRKVWREGFVPNMSTKALKALYDGLLKDDFSLMQGVTTDPPPLRSLEYYSCTGGCGISYAGWKGEELLTVGEVEEYFAKACFEADKLLREPAACRHLLNWFDDTPRKKMRQLLAAEIEYNLMQRQTDVTPVICVNSIYRDIGGEG